MTESLIIYNNPFEKDFWETMHAGMWLLALVFFVAFLIAMAVLNKIPAPRSMRFKTFDYLRVAASFLIALFASRYAMLFSMGLL